MTSVIVFNVLHFQVTTLPQVAISWK